MTLTKRQKMLSAVFVLGLGGLVMDRTILRPQGGPQAASAGSLSTATGAVSASGNTPAAEEPPAPLGVAERLNRLSAGKETGPEELRDPFALPLSWSDSGAGAGEKTPDSMRIFVQKHQLKAVVVQSGESSALIDDKFLVPGQSVDGFTLVSVDQRSAVFERDGKQVILNLIVK